MSPDELALRCAQTMWADDQASQAMGMRLAWVAPGRATVAMRVRDDMVNGYGLCHGGYVATLADSAFAFACNTYDEVTVAAGFDITFVASARLGDDLVAEACERARYGRSGLYDVTVRHIDGWVIAEFRGRSRCLGRPILTSTAQREDRSLREPDRSARSACGGAAPAEPGRAGIGAERREPRSRDRQSAQSQADETDGS
jgi:acyl-CoA thioesterase